MRIVNVSALKGDEILGKQIYDDSGRILLNAGVKLTTSYIEKLKNMDIPSIYVYDELSKEIIIEENVSEKTRQISKYAVKETLDKYIREGRTDNKAIIKSVTSIIDEVLSNKNVLIHMSEVRASDDDIYTHSINVCVMSTIIGMHMGYNMLRLKDIALGAMLHDVGRVKLKKDKKISEKFKVKEELEQYIEIMHPKVGYDLLGEQNLCNGYSKIAVLMHHEKVDGSGYPLKLKGNEINEIAKLITVCDVFDNMISGKKGEKPKPVYEVLEYIVAMSGSYFDAEVIKKFTNNIAVFPTGSGVVLCSNEKCLVSKQNTSMPMRPVVKVIFDKEGNRVTEPYEIDLLKELTLFITGSCEI